MSEEVRFRIDDNGQIALTRVDRRVVCTCGRVLALFNGPTMLIKARASLVDPDHGYTFYCGICRQTTRFHADKKLLTL